MNKLSEKETFKLLIEAIEKDVEKEQMEYCDEDDLEHDGPNVKPSWNGRGSERDRLKRDNKGWELLWKKYLEFGEETGRMVALMLAQDEEERLEYRENGGDYYSGYLKREALKLFDNFLDKWEQRKGSRALQGVLNMVNHIYNQNKLKAFNRKREIERASGDYKKIRRYRERLNNGEKTSRMNFRAHNGNSLRTPSGKKIGYVPLDFGEI